MRYVVVIAGGSGTRLWPLSRTSRPKQLLELGDGRSLLQLAYDRLAGVVPVDHIYVGCGLQHSQAVREHLTDLPPGNILGEPIGRDTANAIGLAAAVLSGDDPDAEIAFVTADHVIEPADEFAAALNEGFAAVSREPRTMVTFGIVPSAPHTGLGYIEKGEPFGDDGRVLTVKAFAEKPDFDRAKEYVASGRYLWNAGTFVWRADTVLAELELQLPETVTGLRKIAAAWEGPNRGEVLTEIYPSLTKVSIDYAVLEPVAAGAGAGGQLVVVPVEVDWLDIGSWTALAGTFGADSSGNTRDAYCALVDSGGNVVVSDDPDHLVAAVGLHDMIVVHTADVTMICPKSDAERVKDLVAHVRDEHGPRFL